VNGKKPTKKCFVCLRPVAMLDGGWPSIAVPDPIRGISYAVVCSEGCATRLKSDPSERQAYAQVSVARSGVGVLLGALLNEGLLGDARGNAA